MTRIPKLDVDQFIKWHSEALPKIPDNLTVYSEVIEFVNRDRDVTPVTKLLLNNSSTFNMLQSLQNKDIRDFVTQATSVTNKNDDVKIITLSSQTFKNTLDLSSCNNYSKGTDTEIIEERAAIIEYDSIIPRCWAEAIAKVQLSSRPKFISQQKWDKINIDLEEICSNYLKDIIFL